VQKEFVRVRLVITSVSTAKGLWWEGMSSRRSGEGAAAAASGHGPLPSLAGLAVVTGADADEPVDESVSARDVRGRTPLHLACRDGDAKGARDLLARGADPKTRDIYGDTPLHMACDHEDCARLLLDVGADANASNEDGDTPLHLTCMRDHSDRVVRILLQGGADANARNEDGDTPLHITCFSRRSDCVALLLEAGASPETRGMWGRMPLGIAMACGHADCARLLLEHGANPNARDTTGSSMYGSAMARGNLSCARLVRRAARLRVEGRVAVDGHFPLDWTESTHHLLAGADRNVLDRALGALLLVDARREGGATLGREGALAFVASLARAAGV
jgi:hypothetical protein